MVPWTILFCSGLEDFGAVTRRPWVLWAGAMLALILLYHFERNTSSRDVTKIGMPLLATAVGPVSYTHLDVYKRQGRQHCGNTDTRRHRSELG